MTRCVCTHEEAKHDGTGVCWGGMDSRAARITPRCLCTAYREGTGEEKPFYNDVKKRLVEIRPRYRRREERG